MEKKNQNVGIKNAFTPNYLLCVIIIRESILVI